MTTYTLYKKTHRKTNLKYLGFTSRQVVHSYIGSGKYWTYHIKKHGYDVDTEILYQSASKEHNKAMGLYYSNLWDIVNSDGWANLIEESGAGGPTKSWSEEERLLMSARNKGQISINKGRTYQEIYGPAKAQEKIEKVKSTWARKNQVNPTRPKPSRTHPHHEERIGLTYAEIFGEERAREISAKKSKSFRGIKNPRYGKPGTFTGRSHSSESVAKMRQPKGPHKTPRQLITCPYCSKTMDASNAKKYHFDRCKSKT